jgi:hypothetical protein
VCVHLHLGTLTSSVHTPPQDPLEPHSLRTVKALFEPLGMLLEPMGLGVKRFLTESLRPRFESVLPRTLAALEAVLVDDEDDSDDAPTELTATGEVRCILYCAPTRSV